MIRALFALVLLLPFFSQSSEAFVFRKIVYCSPIEGVIHWQGKPLANVKVTRFLRSGGFESGENQDHVQTDEQGQFRFETVAERRFLRLDLLSANPYVSQVIEEKLSVTYPSMKRSHTAESYAANITESRSMNELNPNQIFQLSKNAYTAKHGDNPHFRRELDLVLPFVNVDSLKVITATFGLFSPVLSGFGFMAQLNGGRSAEIVIATRGTLTAADWGTDINAASTPGPTGHAIHKGFSTTFKSYVQQLNAFIKQQNLGFKPTAVHCMGHSLGGALAKQAIQLVGR